MNVGIFADCYVPTISGVVASIVQLKEGLEKKGHRAILVVVDTPHHDARDPTIYRFPSIPFNREAGFRLGLVNQRSVTRIVQHERLDIVHTHTEFSIGWAAKRAARSLGLPLIHTAHTMYEEYRHYLLLGTLLPGEVIRGYWSRFLSGYDVLVCPSTKAQDYFAPFTPSISTVVIGNGVSRARFGSGLVTRVERDQIRDGLGIRSSDKVMIYVGRMAKEKRVLELVAVLTPLLRKHTNYKALFVGRGASYRQIMKVVEKSDLRGQVILAGYVSWKQLYQLYSIADVFVTASLSEVHPMTLLEASMCGLPIVARREQGFVGVVKDDYNGYLVDSDREIARRLSEMMRDEATLLRLSRNTLALSDEFDAETHVSRLESLYQQVIHDSSKKEW
jgi:1,2-diacylglycerol 3-alpha-glucosyltransferase